MIIFFSLRYGFVVRCVVFLLVWSCTVGETAPILWEISSVENEALALKAEHGVYQRDNVLWRSDRLNGGAFEKRLDLAF